MDFAAAQRLMAMLPVGARVIDIGGGASPFARADYVLDALPFDAYGAGSDGSVHRRLGAPPRFSRDTWIQLDMCARRPWPFAEKAFDFVVCSHLLEDVRDPIWCCSEIQRIGKAGYIETPSRVEEQSLGVEHPRYAGYYHHRWLVGLEDGRLTFRLKPHNLHAYRSAIVTRLKPNRRISQCHRILSLDWTGSFECGEVLEFSEEAVIEEISQVAARARALPDLTTRIPMSLAQWTMRSFYYWRLSRGWR